jgi:CBS domain-containing protein
MSDTATIAPLLKRRHDALPSRPMGPRSDLALVKLSDPAVHVMTDFRREPPITVAEDHAIDEALRDMIRFGVRALLVVRGEVVSGLITSYDIQGERPLQFLQRSTFTRHEEIQVGHIMTPWTEVPLLEWAAVELASISDILEIFQATGATHLVVVETAADRSMSVRGLISRTQLERQLGPRQESRVIAEHDGRERVP